MVNIFIFLVFYELTVAKLPRTMSLKIPLNMMCVRFIIGILMEIFRLLIQRKSIILAPIKSDHKEICQTLFSKIDLIYDIILH